jgi:hypothetical protein
MLPKFDDGLFAPHRHLPVALITLRHRLNVVSTVPAGRMEGRINYFLHHDMLIVTMENPTILLLLFFLSSFEDLDKRNKTSR